MSGRGRVAESPAVMSERRLRRWVRSEGRHYEHRAFLEELDRRLAGGPLAGDPQARGRLERQHVALRILDAGEGAWQ